MIKYTEAVVLLKRERDQLYKKINENPIIEQGLSNELYAFDSAIILLIELIEGEEDE
ncbi:hypothetical protein [Pseudomonas sp.]|uniref:hypothetical protein n=1 Tax=Pseudomonas sp. TaxID=306 RepID=UPI00261C8E1B|nr:hypothetical protein [Pseudomonas sp.]